MVQTYTEIDSQSAPAHSKLPAVENGPHLGVDAIRAIKVEGTAAGRQTTGQAVALGRNPANGYGKGFGTIAGRAV